MTSTPASRNARATTLAPRSWPSRPGLAITTRILLIKRASRAGPRWPGPLTRSVSGSLDHRSFQARQVAGIPHRLARRPRHFDPPGRLPQLQLLDRGVAQDQVLDPVVPPELDLGLRTVAPAP